MRSLKFYRSDLIASPKAHNKRPKIAEGTCNNISDHWWPDLLLSPGQS